MPTLTPFQPPQLISKYGLKPKRVFGFETQTMNMFHSHYTPTDWAFTDWAFITQALVGQILKEPASKETKDREE